VGEGWGCGGGMVVVCAGGGAVVLTRVVSAQVRWVRCVGTSTGLDPCLLGVRDHVCSGVSGVGGDCGRHQAHMQPPPGATTRSTPRTWGCP